MESDINVKSFGCDESKALKNYDAMIKAVSLEGVFFFFSSFLFREAIYGVLFLPLTEKLKLN